MHTPVDTPHRQHTSYLSRGDDTDYIEKGSVVWLVRGTCGRATVADCTAA